MVSPPRPKKLRPGEVAAAIGTTYKAISHWLYRYGEKGVAPTAEQAGTWAEFSWGDVAALAITKYLIDLGMPVTGAHTIAKRLVELRWPALFDEENPHWSMSNELMHWFLFLERDGNWSFGSFEKFDGGSVPPSSRAHILLPIGGIVSDAFNALRDMGHERPPYDHSRVTEELWPNEKTKLRNRLLTNLQRSKDLTEQMVLQGHALEKELQEITQAFRATNDQSELAWFDEQVEQAKVHMQAHMEHVQRQVERTSPPPPPGEEDRPRDPADEPARRARRRPGRPRRQPRKGNVT